MRYRHSCAIPSVALALTLSAACAAPGTAPGAVPAAKPQATLQDVSWLVGSWRANQDGKPVEETWSPPASGMMLGMNRVDDGSAEPFYEYLRIEQDKDGSLVYQAAPRGEYPVPFQLDSMAPDRVAFVNPEHDFPQRIVYWLEDGALHARIEGETPDGTKSSEWHYRKAE